MNLRDIRIYDTIEDADGGRASSIQKPPLPRKHERRDAFQDWIWRDPERRQTLVQQYNGK